MYTAQRSRFFVATIFFLLALWLAGSFERAQAQGIIIDPPMPPAEPLPPLTPPLKLDEHRVEAVIDGPVAQVQLTQVFHNETGHTVEGVYIFPLPADAAVSDFQMTMNGQVLEGKLLDKDQARRIYEEIVRRRRDPALLEYIGRNLFQTNVFPIPAGESRTLALNYTQIVPQKEGLFEFVYPLRTHQYSNAPVRSLAISIELRNQPGLRTLYSPNFDIQIERIGDDRALIGYEATNVQPESDFRLFFGTAKDEIGLNILTYKPAGEDGFFVLLAAPGMNVSEEAVVARDIVLVVDVSGSMQGDKIEQARDAAHFVVDHLNPDDRFNLISFSTGVRLWEGDLRDVDQAARMDAHAWIDRLAANGSTDINRALLEGLGQLQRAGDGDRPGYVLFLTDGLPTMGETDTERIINNAQNNKPAESRIRLFTFGVGFDVNTDLLDTISREMGGRSSYVQPDEAIDEVVGTFYAGISTPVLVDISIDFGEDIVVDDLFPFPLPDLFAGDQLLVAGRYRTGGEAVITLRGAVNSETVTLQFAGHSFVESGGEPFVARLWATRKIGALLEQIRRNGPHQELIDEIVDLSLQYGIVTPYTSYLVVEPEMSVAGGDGVEPDEPVFALRAQAEDEVAEQVQAAAAAAPSGEAAVAASETRSALANAVNVFDTSGVRYVGGKTFVHQRTVQTADGRALDLWVDTRYTAEMAVEIVEFGSARYFTLTRQPEMAAWLAISPEMVIVVDGNRAIRITTTR
jgi:Ca-activated chloride channel family protein